MIFKSLRPDEVLVASLGVSKRLFNRVLWGTHTTGHVLYGAGMKLRKRGVAVETVHDANHADEVFCAKYTRWIPLSVVELALVSTYGAKPVWGAVDLR